MIALPNVVAVELNIPPKYSVCPLCSSFVRLACDFHPIGAVTLVLVFDLTDTVLCTAVLVEATNGGGGTSTSRPRSGPFHSRVSGRQILREFLRQGCHTRLLTGAGVPSGRGQVNLAAPDACSTIQLVVSGGDLFRVRFHFSDIRSRFIAGVSVFKLDLSTRAWVKAESLVVRTFGSIPLSRG
jgi:hypothetical protein